MIQLGMAQQVPYRSAHPCFFIPCPEYNALHAGEHYGPGAHRARLERHVESAVVEPPAIELGGRLPDGEKLRVRSGILIANRPVRRRGEDGSITHDNRSDRHLVSLYRFTSQVERVSYVLLVYRDRRCADAELFGCGVAICRQVLALSTS
jgi:hypothetical protein